MMDFVEIAKLGSQVVLDGLLLWLVMKYLPRRDEKFMVELQRHTAQLNRLVKAFVLSLDDDDQKRHKLTDEIFGGRDDDSKTS